MIVVATDEEYKLAKKRFKHHIIVKTGVGGVNVIKKLKRLPKWIKITNFGYVGSNNLPVGTEVRVGWCELYHPNVKYKEPTFATKDFITSGVCCYTSNDFVLETKEYRSCVFDMELAYICALGFKNVKSIKIVSDNLSLNEYEQNI